MQPFANTLVTVPLTGAQLKAVLEQQWKAEGERPKLHLGVSEGFSYEYTEIAPLPGESVGRAGEIVSMTYRGEPIEPDDVVTVVTNSFLAAGGDGFSAFAEGTTPTDTGRIDLAATVDYFASLDVVDPAPLGRAVKVTQPTEPGEPGEPGEDTPWATVTLSATTVEQGDSFRVELTGLTPGQRVGATLFSDPLVIDGIPAADAEGRLAFTVRMKADQYVYSAGSEKDSGGIRRGFIPRADGTEERTYGSASTGGFDAAEWSQRVADHHGDVTEAMKEWLVETGRAVEDADIAYLEVRGWIPE